jgi:cytosine deaminase
MPCFLCAGAVVEFKIPKVIAGESKNYAGAKKLLRSHNVKVVDLDSAECRQMMRSFIKKKPKLWKEDIGGL